MRILFFLVSLLATIEGVAQAPTVTVNNCWGVIEVVLLDASKADGYFRKSSSSPGNEINILLDKNGFLRYQGTEYSTTEELVSALNWDKFRQGTSGSWYLHVGIHIDTPISKFYKLGCALQELSLQYEEVVLYTFGRLR